LYRESMRLDIAHSPHYSRLQLIARFVAGPLYIMLPHALLLMPLAVVSVVLMPVAWAAILITGQYPERLFRFEVGLLRWQLRVNASLYHLVDGYPRFGLGEDDGPVTFTVDRPERSGRVHLLVRLLLGWAYCLLPHLVVLLLRGVIMFVLMVVAAVSVLVTGKYPLPFHRFNVATLRHAMRVRLYMGAMTERYPFFL
jgi:hypothetical protein